MAPHLVDCFILLWYPCHGLIVVALSSWPCCHCHCDRRRCLYCHQHCLCCRCRHRSLSPSSSPLLSSPVSFVAAKQWWHSNERSDGHSNGREGGGAAMAMAAQQRQWQRSNGLGSAATAMVVQQRQWRRSDGNGIGGAAMGVAVVVAVQQWRRSNGGGGAAMVVDRYLRVP